MKLPVRARPRRCAALLLGIPLLAAAAAPARVQVEVSGFDCHGSRDTYSYVATWPDAASSGSYLVKLGNQCVLGGRQCTTNARRSCEAACAAGRCRAEFVSCRVGAPGYLIVYARNGGALGENRYRPPPCR